MPAIAKRVNVGLDADTIYMLNLLVKKTKSSMSEVCANFIRRGIEEDEDAYDIKLLEEMGDIDNMETYSLEEMKKMLHNVQD